jgi:hypothetical protein
MVQPPNPAKTMEKNLPSSSLRKKLQAKAKDMICAKQLGAARRITNQLSTRMTMMKSLTQRCRLTCIEFE